MIVTTLIENTCRDHRAGLKAEHGLSLFIEWDGRALLFDTGTSGDFVANAKRLEVDLCRAEGTVISHHHYDHGGGLEALLSTCPGMPVYLHASSASYRWFYAFRLLRRPIGIAPAVFQAHAENFHFLEQDTEVFPGVHVLTSIETRYPTPRGNRFLYVEEGGELKPDPFDHEVVLVIEDGGSLVVFTGCSHNGVRNMVDEVVRRFPGKPVRALFGGFHLVGIPIINTMAESKAEVVGLGKALLDYPVERYYTGHCTGPKAYRLLKMVMGDRLEPMTTGQRVSV